MTRTRWLQERRMEKFEDMPGRFESRRLSAPDAAELPGMSERTFRRYRRGWEEDGLEGLTSSASARSCTHFLSSPSRPCPRFD